MLKKQSILIHPGETVFAEAPAEIKTLLGSCVAVTAWHPELKIGGICHFQLAERKSQSKIKDNLRYAEFALPEMQEKMQSYVSELSDFHIGLFGGSNLFATSKLKTVGKKNLKVARTWLKQHQLTLNNEDTGDIFCRNLTLDLNTGVVAVERYMVDSEKIFK